jgi:ketosteroid isomerase-like protein
MKNIERGIYLFIITGIIFISCVKKADHEKVVDQIMDVEQQFNNYASEQGVEEAFLEFAADSAVLNRGGRIIKGKSAIRNYFENQPYSDVTLSWKPDAVNVSKDGSMAYTYGSFSFSAMDSLNNPVRANGIFHTVWERQQDGSWKYVYD